jgi:hypothetical protein
MTGALQLCKTCGGETKVATLGSFRGEEGPVELVVNGMPALVCANDHKRFLYPEFVARLIDFVSDPEKVAPQPPAVKRGLLKKRYHCSGCDAELPAVPAGKSKRALDASFANAAPFKVEIQVALHKCAGCGREQVLSNEEVAGSAFKAVTQGFREADVHVNR